ncbi:glycoside hydrolase family 28 protein [Flavobacterium sp. GSA192]|uniref:glycoside hydrolase family 28 protein n=1 Tax=Flavobacterium sp. GSA192 TaxID=2576304 RepID=UPI001127D672|nr:glycoside hydrolase family 28 protein [Flavobacterium sp. GSA192]
MQNKLHRSFFSFSIVLVSAFLTNCSAQKGANAILANPWKVKQQIEKSVVVPVFVNKNYSIVDYGAKSGGLINNSEAFKKAIEACAKNGGGKVVIPSGKFLTGPIHLDNNVNLHLEAGAEILFSTKSSDYPLVRTSFEGTELMNHSPLIYAYNKKNVAVTGKGILNGQADNDNWWYWCGAKQYGWAEGRGNQNDPQNRIRLVESGEQNVPVDERIYGEGSYLRPNFIEFFGCTDALIKDVKIINAPFWVIHPMKSTNVTVDGVTVESHGPNNDGCDPEYSKNVIIKNCTFNSGDDCIAIKAGKDGDGRRVAMKSENIIVKDCKMLDGHGGVVMGSEMTGGIKNVFVENCAMDSPNLDRAIRIKSNSRRGGIVENVFVRNIKVGQVKEAVLRINMFYNVYGNQTGNYIPQVKNVILENVKVKNGGKYGVLAQGYKELPIENVLLKNVTIEKVGEAYSIDNVKNIQFINTYINGKKVASPKGL